MLAARVEAVEFKLAAMKRLAIVFFGFVLVVVAQLAQASSQSTVVFSKHTPALKLVSFDRETDTYRFDGTIALTGTIYVEFDMATAYRANGYVTFEKFVPDKSELPKLPAVVSGPYAAHVQFVSLDATDDQLAAVFGVKEAFARISHGAAHAVNSSVRVVLNRYSAYVECDARGYSAHVVSISAASRVAAVPAGSVPAGC